MTPTAKRDCLATWLATQIDPSCKRCTKCKVKAGMMRRQCTMVVIAKILRIRDHNELHVHGDRQQGTS
jgi:hypothetical protein